MIAVVIPAYNPDDVLLKLSLDVLSLSEQIDDICVTIVVVNDGSDTPQSARVFSGLEALPHVTCLAHTQNKGKGAALKTGLGYCKMSECRFVVTADADGQHTAQDIIRVACHARDTNHFTIGTRDFDGKVPFRSRFGNKLTQTLFKLVNRQNIQDTQSGLRGFPASKIDAMLNVSHNRYEYEFAVLIDAAQNSHIAQLPIQTLYQEGNPTSHFRPLRDSALIYAVLIRYCFYVPIIASLDIGMFFGLSQIFSAPTAFGVVRCITTIIYFIVMRKIVFKSSGRLFPQVIEFSLLALFNILIIWSLLFGLARYINVGAGLLYILGTLALFLFNFLIQRYVVFKQQS